MHLQLSTVTKPCNPGCTLGMNPRSLSSIRPLRAFDAHWRRFGAARQAVASRPVTLQETYRGCEAFSGAAQAMAIFSLAESPHIAGSDVKSALSCSYSCWATNSSLGAPAVCACQRSSVSICRGQRSCQLSTCVRISQAKSTYSTDLLQSAGISTLRANIWRPCSAQVNPHNVPSERVRPRLQAHVLIVPGRRSLCPWVPFRNHVSQVLVVNRALCCSEAGVGHIECFPDLAFVTSAASLQPLLRKGSCTHCSVWLALGVTT